MKIWQLVTKDYAVYLKENLSPTTFKNFSVWLKVCLMEDDIISHLHSSFPFFPRVFTTLARCRAWGHLPAWKHLPLKFSPFQHNIRHKKQCYDIFRYLLMYFDWKNKLKVSRVNINGLMIWKENDIRDEITFLAFNSFKILFRTEYMSNNNF